jgi:hypothetical protein
MRIKALIMAASIAVPSVACADTTADLQSRYDAMKAAMAARDSSAIRALLTSDFTATDIIGETENAAQMIAGVQLLKPDPDKKTQTTLLSVTVNGDTAEVEQTYDITAQKTGANGQVYAVELKTQSHDTWKKIGASWLLSSTRTEHLDYSVNGKIIMHKEAGQ